MIITKRFKTNFTPVKLVAEDIGYSPSLIYKWLRDYQKAGFDKHRLFYTQGDYGLRTLFFVYILSLLQNHIGNNYPPCSAAVFCGSVYYFLCSLGQKFVGCGGVALNDVKYVRGIFINGGLVHLPDFQTAKHLV